MTSTGIRLEQPSVHSAVSYVKPEHALNRGFPCFQNTHSSPDIGINPEMEPTSSSFRDFSPRKTPSNMLKMPDIKLQSTSSKSSSSWMNDSGKLSGGPNRFSMRDAGPEEGETKETASATC